MGYNLKKFLIGFAITVGGLIIVAFILLTISNFLPSTTHDKIMAMIHGNNAQSVSSKQTQIDNSQPKTNQLNDQQKQEAKQYYDQALSLIAKFSNWNECLDLINKALDIDPSNTDYLRLKDEVLYNLKEYQSAIDLGKQIVSQKPSSTDYSIIAQSYEGLGNLDMADSYYDKAIAVSKDKESTFDYWVFKADIAHKMTKYDTALDDFRQAVNADPSKKLVFDVMGKFYKMFGNPSEMLQYGEGYRLHPQFMNKTVNNSGSSELNDVNNEINILETAVLKGQSSVDYNFPAIYKSVRSAACLGLDVYSADLYSKSTQSDPKNNNVANSEKVFTNEEATIMGIHLLDPVEKVKGLLGEPSSKTNTGTWVYSLGNDNNLKVDFDGSGNVKDVYSYGANAPSFFNLKTGDSYDKVIQFLGQGMGGGDGIHYKTQGGMVTIGVDTDNRNVSYFSLVQSY